MTLVERAKAAYESTPDSPDEITRPWAKVQSRLRIWQAGLPGPKDAALMALGVVEEFFLEYYDALAEDDSEENVRDAIGDATVFLMQLLSEYRLDFDALLSADIGEEGFLAALGRGIGLVAQALRKERQAFRSMTRDDARAQIALGGALVAQALEERCRDHVVDYYGIVAQVADKVIARTPVK